MFTQSALLKFCVITTLSLSNCDDSIVFESDRAQRERILSMFGQNESLMVHSLLEAETNSQQAFELAQKFGDPQILNAAELDLKVVKGLRTGSLRESDFHRLTLEVQDLKTGEDPALVFHSNYVVALASMMHHQCGANLKLILDGMRRGAETTGDRSLSGRHKWLELFVGLCYANRYFNEPSDEEVAQLIKSLPDDEDWNSQSMNQLNQFVKGFDAVETKNRPRVIQSAIPNRLLTLKLLETKCHVLLQNNHNEEAISTYEQAVEISRNLGCPSVTLALDQKLLRLKAEFSQEPDVQGSEIAILSNPADRSLSIVSRYDSKVMIQNSFEKVDAPTGEILTQASTNYYPQKDVQEHVRQTTALNQSYTRLLDERRQNEEQLDSVKLANQAAVESQHLTLSRLRIYSFVATLLLLGLLLCLFLFLQQKRIHDINQKLVSEQHRVQASEAKVDGLTNRLARIERMNSLGLMAGGIAHDFNNLLVGILGNVELIQMVGDEAGLDFIRERVASVRESAEKAADISRNMLAYAGKQPIQRRDVDLNDLLSKFEGVMTTACLPTQSLNLVLANYGIRVSIDPTMAERSILNLVKNASQFSPADGSITLSTRIVSGSESEDSTALGESTHRGDFAVIEVADFGSGVASDQRERIFEPFYSTREHGRGLGLAVVYGFVKSHNGMVNCTSSPSTGTCFSIKLPLVDVPITPPVCNLDGLPDRDDTDVRLTLFNGSGKTVLMIDDDSAVVDLCQRLLELAGWRVIVAVSGQGGLEKMLQHQNEIHCVLLDIVMPDMSAGEVLNEFEARKIWTPVVLISGFSKIQLESYYARPNVTAIITKPFRNRDILSALFHAAMVQECETPPLQANTNPANSQNSRS